MNSSSLSLCTFTMMNKSKSLLRVSNFSYYFTPKLTFPNPSYKENTKWRLTNACHVSLELSGFTRHII